LVLNRLRLCRKLFPELSNDMHVTDILLICLAMAPILAVVAGEAADDAKLMQGNWTPVTAELAGEPMGTVALKTISLKLENGKYEVFVGEHPDRGTYTIDSATKPKSITVVGTQGPNQGKTYPAIYELDGDTLRVCYDLSGAKRPAEFKSVTGTMLYLVTYQRRKG
jgi:uncharacterized protein (TIGR03067 family)